MKPPGLIEDESLVEDDDEAAAAAAAVLASINCWLVSENIALAFDNEP